MPRSRNRDGLGRDANQRDVPDDRFPAPAPSRADAPHDDDLEDGPVIEGSLEAFFDFDSKPARKAPGVIPGTREAEEREREDDEPEYDGPSKTQRKADMAALQALGEELVGLPADAVDPLELPERLHDAIREARRIRSHEGRRRQLQFIGKLMRGVDPAPIRAMLARRAKPLRDEVMAMHRAEAWRDRLIADNGALERLLAELPRLVAPGADLQGLRATIRAARVEVAGQRRGRHYRELYRRVHDALLAEAAAEAAADAAKAPADDDRDDAHDD